MSNADGERQKQRLAAVVLANNIMLFLVIYLQHGRASVAMSLYKKTLKDLYVHV